MASQDLDEDQLAVYLHITPQQVRKLADRGRLPGRRVGGSWRFAEAEIHSWLEDQIGISEGEDLDRVQDVVERWSGTEDLDSFTIDRLLLIDAIEVPLTARTRGSVVRNMCAIAERTGLLWDASRMMDAVLAREDLHPTALDIGVALLHPRRPQASILGEPLLALGVSPQPIPFGNQSGHLTDVFFLICSTDDRVHLQVLAKLSQMLGKPEFLTELRASGDAKSAKSIVAKYEHMLDSEENGE